MKVAMIGQKGLPATFGGVERHCEELGSRLVSMGCDITVFCRPYYSSKKIAELNLEALRPRRFLYKGMTLELLPSIPTKHLDAASHSILCSLFAAFRDYDLIHYHALGPTLFSPIVQFFNKRTVSTIHGLDWQRAKWGAFAKKVLRLGEKIASGRPDALIVVSRTLQNYFRHKYKKNAHYIPNGIIRPRPLPAREISVRWKLEKDSYILFVGRLVPEKGCHHLISAFRKIDTDKALIIAGGASHSDQYVNHLHKQAEGDGRILFTGYVYGNILHELYSNACLYVHPSEIEGLPLTLLEALSYGACALASDIPENAEIVSPEGREEYGFLFQSRNPESLRLKLEELLAHPMVVKERGALAGEQVSKTYNWDRIAEETLNIYRMVCEKRRASK